MRGGLLGAPARPAMAVGDHPWLASLHHSNEDDRMPSPDLQLPTEGDPRSRSLEGRVAVVTGASRGAGRGIALELGAAGATVYITGRSTRTRPLTAANSAYGGMLGQTSLAAMPGTVDDTADDVAALGGVGIAVPCDHTDPAAVAALFARVEREQGRLDLLVNNAWGGHEAFDLAGFGAPYWEQPLSQWDAMFTRGVRNHVLASQCAAPMLVRQGRGLIVTTTFWDRDRFLAGNLLYDLAKATMTRLAFALAEELRPHGVASVAVSPGWMRTELVLAVHGADERTWSDRPALAATESPRYIGRAVAALATDPDVLALSGGAYRVGDLAVAYDFTDVDGRRVPAFELPRATGAGEGDGPSGVGAGEPGDAALALRRDRRSSASYTSG